MVEGGGLENRCAGNRSGGSNPSSSALECSVYNGCTASLVVGSISTECFESSRFGALGLSFRFLTLAQ